MFTWAQVTESILSNSFDHLMCHLCKNSWEISWVESHKHVTVETHKSVWLVQSASCLMCSIHSHLANYAHKQRRWRHCNFHTLQNVQGRTGRFGGLDLDPEPLVCLSCPNRNTSEICFYSKRKNDLFRPSETHPAGTGPMRAEPDLWRVSTN